MSTRALLWIAISVLAVAVVVTGGCPKKVQQATEAVRTVQDAQDGDFTVKGEKGEEVKVETEGKDGEDATVTMTGPEGQTTTVETGDKAVSESDVGVAFYPGATVDAGGTVSSGGEKGGTYAQVSLTTSDPFDKVATFYKDKYAKGNTSVDGPGNLMIVFDEGENKGKVVTVTEDKAAGKTTIVIAAASGG
jgi:hypothetical protein